MTGLSRGVCQFTGLLTTALLPPNAPDESRRRCPNAIEPDPKFVSGIRPRQIQSTLQRERTLDLAVVTAVDAFVLKFVKLRLHRGRRVPSAGLVSDRTIGQVSDVQLLSQFRFGHRPEFVGATTHEPSCDRLRTHGRMGVDEDRTMSRPHCKPCHLRP